MTMFGSISRLALAGAFVFALAACNKDSGSPASTTTPEGTVQAAVANLKAGDIKALMESQLPPAELDKMRAQWKEKLAKDPPSDTERAEFEQQMAELTAADAEAKLLEKVEPQLVQFETQYAAQLPILAGAGRQMMGEQINKNPDLNAQQKAQALKALDALVKWVQSTNFTDRAKIKAAIADVVAAARDLKLVKLDDVQALSFDQAMDKASIAFRALKKVLASYGFSIDAALDTAKVTTLSSEGDKARVKVTYTLLDTPLEMETDMVRIDGRWYGKETIENLQKATAQATGMDDQPQIAPGGDEPAMDPMPEEGATEGDASGDASDENG
jgi:hypothetical protein